MPPRRPSELAAALSVARTLRGGSRRVSVPLSMVLLVTARRAARTCSRRLLR
ncbi:MAG TPA: hypothetical protein VFK05_10710 [Polyangiaceae bacterium]|nr:hypothetical protein [Polyangiaceae bacterium]